MATPFLMVDLADATRQRARGVADAMALLLRFSDLDLHQRLSPSAPLERIVFDLLEQLRCESLAPVELAGLRANLDASFDAWCSSARSERVDESRSAMLVYTVTHMARSRLLGRSVPEDVDELIETTRGHVGPIVGHAIRRLRATSVSQEAYAVPAREIARLVAEIADDSTVAGNAASLATRFRLFVPSGWDAPESVGDGDHAGGRTTEHGGAAGDGDLATLGDYHVYTRAHDRVVTGRSLYPAERLARHRSDLDRLVAAQAVSAPRLAQRMLQLFGTPSDDDWRFGVDDGVLDGRRLAQLVANEDYHELFRRRRQQRVPDTVVAFLIDNSGSMKRQRFETVAVLIDTFSRALDLAGVSNEVLGFTTGAWTGGRPLDEWRAAGSPPAAGRVNEALHIVYKDAATSWRRARPSLAAMLSVLHFREGIDGEAVAWAHGRLVARPEPRKILVVVSDGAPNDSATSNANRDGFLDDHLRAVAGEIEGRVRRRVPGAVELAAIGIDLDVGGYYRRCVDLDLTGTLGLHHYRVLEELAPLRG